MVVLLVTLIFWSRAAEEALSKSQLKAFERKCSSDLMGIVEMVRGQLTSLQRQTLGALVVTDVHARDVVSNLVSEQVSSASEFSWQVLSRLPIDPREQAG
jgi:dynein heavy chain